MAPLSRDSARFQVGAWSVDPATGQISRENEVRRARPLVGDLLLYLAAHAGEVVTKDDLVAGPWGGAAIADSALTSTIAELRELLDDQPRSPRYIQTIPKRGYRLIAPVTLPEETIASAPERIASSTPSASAPLASAPGVATAAVPEQLEAVRAETAPVAQAANATTARTHWSRRSLALAFGLGAAFTVATTVSIASRRRPSAPPQTPRAMRLTVDLPHGVRLAPDSIPRLALTADGTRMAYVIRTDAGPALYTRTLDQFEAHPVSGTNDASAPFFSPDGSRLGYFANGELRIVPISGGESVALCEARVPLGASWGADDTIVFSGTHGRGLFEVPAAGGPPREFTTPDASRGELSHRWPQILPDGIHVLYTAIGHGRADVLVVSRQTGDHHLVIENAQAAMFVQPDRVLFERDGRVMQATLDPDRFELTSPPRVLVGDVSPAGPGFGNPLFTVAGGGALVYVPIDPHEADRELVWVDRAGRVSTLGAPPRSYMHPRLSPDGRQILTWLRKKDPDLWLFDIGTRALTRLVTGVAARRAAWSPDGLRVTFDGPGPDNPVMLYEADIRGGEAHRLRPEKNSQYAGTWTPDGRTIAFLDLRKTTGFDIVTMRDEPNATATPLLHSAANETAPAFSPDGRWLAFVSDATGREEVYLLPYPADGSPVQVSTTGGREPVWSKRGDELFYRQGQTMYAVGVTGTTSPRVTDPEALFTGEFDQRPIFHANYDVAGDGRFLMIRGIAPSTTDTQIAVLLRWDLP
jgi:DNA-binding winged helix-turn-helix (wHTH) protein/Tol biopolymer transport system component